MATMNVQPTNPNNPIVFFDVTIGGQVSGERRKDVEVTFVFRLFSLRSANASIMDSALT